MNLEKLQSQDISAPKTLENKQHIELPDDSGRRAGEKELPGDTGADFQKEKQFLERIDRQELADTDRTKMKEISGWTDKIIDYIGSWKEFEIYRNAGLVEAQIGDKHCLIRNDINWEQNSLQISKTLCRAWAAQTKNVLSKACHQSIKMVKL